ncbi:choice-of-anchor K domain-containing protein, partial [Thermaurantiacus sp.]
SGITGSGTVSFQFLNVSGPMATIPLSALGNTPYFNQGRFNGDLAEMDSEYDPVGEGSPYVFVQGGYTFAPGVSNVEFRYDWMPAGSNSVNKLVFTPASFSNVQPGQLFLLGTITYTNGAWHGGGDTPAFNRPTSFAFELTTISTNNPAFNRTVRASIVNVTNALTYGPGEFPPTNLAVQNAEADWIYLEGYEQLGSLRVYDFCCGPLAMAIPGRWSSGAPLARSISSSCAIPVAAF